MAGVQQRSLPGSAAAGATNSAPAKADAAILIGFISYLLVRVSVTHNAPGRFVFLVRFTLLNIGLHYRKHDLRAVFRRPEAGHEERLAAPAVCITIEHRRVGDDLGQTRRFRHVRVMPAFTLKAHIDR